MLEYILLIFYRKKCPEDRVTFLSNFHNGLYKLRVALALPQRKCSGRTYGKLLGLPGLQHTSLGVLIDESWKVAMMITAYICITFSGAFTYLPYLFLTIILSDGQGIHYKLYCDRLNNGPLKDI